MMRMVVVLGTMRPVPLGLARRRRLGRRCSVRFASAAAEERERAAAPIFLRTLTVVCTNSASLLHFATATLADPFVSNESSSPHAEPAMDGRCLAATPPVAILLYTRMNEFVLVFLVV